MEVAELFATRIGYLLLGQIEAATTATGLLLAAKRIQDYREAATLNDFFLADVGVATGLAFIVLRSIAVLYGVKYIAGD